ncbi:unnamed protein product [Urochloa humidicola]
MLRKGETHGGCSVEGEAARAGSERNGAVGDCRGREEAESTGKQRRRRAGAAGPQLTPMLSAPSMSDGGDRRRRVPWHPCLWQVEAAVLRSTRPARLCADHCSPPRRPPRPLSRSPCPRCTAPSPGSFRGQPPASHASSFPSSHRIRPRRDDGAQLTVPERRCCPGGSRRAPIEARPSQSTRG